MHIVPVENLFVSFMLLNNTFLNTSDKSVSSIDSKFLTNASTVPNATTVPVKNKIRPNGFLIKSNNKNLSIGVTTHTSEIDPHNEHKEISTTWTVESSNITTTTNSATTSVHTVQVPPVAIQYHQNQEPQILLDMNTPPAYILKSYDLRYDGNHTGDTEGLNKTDGLTNFTLIQEIICFPKRKPNGVESSNTTHPTPLFKETVNNNKVIRLNMNKHPRQKVKTYVKTTPVYNKANKTPSPLLIHVFQKSKSLRAEGSKLDENKVDENMPLLPAIPLPDIIQDGDDILDTVHDAIKTKLSEKEPGSKTPYLIKGSTKVRSRAKTKAKLTIPVTGGYLEYSNRLIPEFPEEKNYPFTIRNKYQDKPMNHFTSR
ncbi:hypothetical protein M8J75_011196 [Diaphorina citri]|nr:hypothetical protein M8J75_011196 [Diaphorina citri]